MRGAIPPLSQYISWHGFYLSAEYVFIAWYLVKYRHFTVLHLPHRVQNGSRPTQSPIQWVPGALSLGIKRPGLEADNLPVLYLYE
jgi:hypothetical protein